MSEPPTQTPTKIITAFCDICEKLCLIEQLKTVYAYGIETIACNECREEEGL